MLLSALLCRPRSFAVLSLIPSLLILLSGCPAAHAGSYTVAYSGGTYTAPNSQGVQTSYPYALSNSGYGGASGGNGAPSCTGTISTTFTWQPAAGQTMTTDPPPTTVVAIENCTVSASANHPGSTGSYDTGFSGNGQSGSVPFTFGGSNSVTVSGIRYTTPAGGATVTLAATPSASSTTIGAASSVYYTASLSPVTINLVGTTPDSDGNHNILIGQSCSASLPDLPIPSGSSVSYQWSVTGTTFQSWTVSSDQSHTTEVDGPGLLDQPTASWFWDELEAEDRVVSCTATVTPPVGQGSPFTVTPSELVSVYVPNWTATGTGGYVKVNLPPNTEDYTTYEIFAGATIPMENAGQLNGMNIQASVASPVPALFGNGSLELVQLVTPRESWVLQNGTETKPIFAPQYGEEGLDGEYPYGWVTASIAPGIPTYTTGDTPGFNLRDIYMISANLKHDFEDYLMYLAPGSQQPVPVARFIWNDNGTANIPTTLYWRDYAAQHNGSDAAGTVTPSGNQSLFLPYNEFPSWTQID